jgi:hypothetical protein
MLKVCGKIISTRFADYNKILQEKNTGDEEFLQIYRIIKNFGLFLIFDFGNEPPLKNEFSSLFARIYVIKIGVVICGMFCRFSWFFVKNLPMSRPKATHSD